MCVVAQAACIRRRLFKAGDGQGGQVEEGAQVLVKGLGEVAKGWEGPAKAAGIVCIYIIMTVHGMGLLQVCWV